MKISATKKALTYRVWFKALIVCIMFIPVITEIRYEPQNTMNVIAEVLTHPYINNIGIFLPVAKVILIFVVLSPFFINAKGSGRLIFTYYSVLLLAIGLFQNMADTRYGFTFILGNLIVQYTIAAFCICDGIKGKSLFDKQSLDSKKLWIVPLMLLAILMPYSIKNGIIVPAIETVFTNEAGVTYCMITPVIMGLLILFHKSVYKPTMHIVSFLGSGFGILNMMTWFGFRLTDWWMGVLHIPLLILSFYGLYLSREKAD
ncbi:MAG: hypothetical protein ACI4KH_04370 [Oscillospiraceae bacterium]